MGIQLDADLAALRFRQARKLAAAGTVPADWVDLVRRLEAGERTYVAVLATALLAKATDPAVDSLTLSPSAGPHGYAARTFAKESLVPLAFEAGVDLGTGGDDPLANQPFFHLKRVDEPGVRVRSRPRFDELVGALNRVNSLDVRKATEALAAFIQVRSATEGVDFAAGTAASSIARLVEAALAFVVEDPEDGRRGQAFVAAALDLVFDAVETGRVNDPSRKRPGDVRVLDDGRVSFAVEVRQKPVTPTQIRQFAKRLRDDGIGKGAMALLASTQRRVDAPRLRAEALREHDVQLEIIEGVEDVLRTALQWSRLPLRQAMGAFVDRMKVRLRQLKVRRGSLETWDRVAKEIAAER